MKSIVLDALFALLLCGAVTDLNAAGVGKAVARSAGRKISISATARTVGGHKAVTAAEKARRPMVDILRRDRVRDSRLPVRKLEQPRKVFRFTTLKQARLYRQTGVPSGTHFTAKVGPGRPLTAAHAKERYGLPRIPRARLQFLLPKGTTVKSGKVIGGKPGFGEVKTYRHRLEPSAVKNLVRLKK